MNGLNSFISGKKEDENDRKLFRQNIPIITCSLNDEQGRRVHFLNDTTPTPQPACLNFPFQDRKPIGKGGRIAQARIQAHSRCMGKKNPRQVTC